MAKIYEIVKYGTPVLREKAEPVAEVTDEIRALARDMFATMHAANGVGLAAEQVGKRIALCVVQIPVEYDVEEEGGPRLNRDDLLRLALVNPRIVETSARTWKMSEGCLSFPDITGSVERPWAITLEFTDLHGKPRREQLQGFLARACQHEIDHLQGVVFIDRMSYARRLALKGRLRRLKDNTEAGAQP
ncbi:MAG: peptide deformylase [Kiritimatiellae bacterium]|nr:peptide deformylase [Kiritimatiellia bacterium]